MPVKAPNIIIPTGYEEARRKAERKRKIAEAMMARGLATNPNMQSWTQVLGQIGSAWAGKRLDKKADKLDTETDEAIRADYADRIAAFQERAKGLDPSSPTYQQDLMDLAQSGSSDPMLESFAKPYTEAAEAGLKQQGEMTNFGGQMRRKGNIAEGEFEPNKPTDMVLRAGPEGRTFVPNTARITAALASQPNVNITGGVTSMPDPMAQQRPGMPAVPAQPTQPMPSQEQSDVVFGQMSPEEKQIVNNILQKYAGKGASVTSIVPQGVPYGNPTDPSMGGTRPPDGVTTDGQPYWLVNGVPYDNPEGR